MGAASSTRREFLRNIALSAGALAEPRWPLTAAEQRKRPVRLNAPRPNILVMLSDDMGWNQPGFQGGPIDTPNLDQLATESVSLTQFYVQPVCTPTRACLLTGRYAFKTGTVIRFTANDTAGMLLDERTLADALKEAGYWTALCGKWHLGEWQKAHLPMQRGFDHQYGHYSALIDYNTHYRNKVHDWHRNERPVFEEGYSTDLIAREVERLILAHDTAKPFFIFVPFNAVHGPHANQAPQAVVQKYQGMPGVANAEQAAQVDLMDVAIGRILRALDTKGIRDNTLVMFFNDNGGPGNIDNAPYRGGKSAYFEGGMRMPTLLRWPGYITAGSTVNEMLHVVDMYPTFINLAGGSPAQPLPLDGLDAWATITQGAPTPHDEIVHGLKVLRKGDWKYIDEDATYYNWSAQETHLYNIKDDPYEQNNLAAANPVKVAEMQARLAFHATLERPAEQHQPIPNFPPRMYGEDENRASLQWPGLRTF